MAAEEENLNASGQFSFRGIEYVIFMTAEKDGNSFTIEVEDSLTFDRWCGTFDVECKYKYLIYLFCFLI